MSYGRRLILPALLVALGHPLLPSLTSPLHGEETPEMSGTEGGGFDEPSPGEEGVASYYAKRFDGRKTYSGARYLPERMTAASPDLPMGARLRVKNLANGREVVVTVNDRCRKRRHPFIDLSRAAAKRLGFFGRGTARVLITRLKDEENSETDGGSTVD